jgi:MFS family permease
MRRSASELTRPAVLTAIGCAIGMAAGPTPMVSAVAGLFMKPLSAEFSLSRTAISAILLLSPLIVSLCAPTGGRLIDRFGVPRVLLPVVLLFAAANAAMSLVHSLWQYIALAAIISACISVHCYASYTKVLALWFRRRRGVVTGLSIACGSGLGAAIIPQLVTPWIGEHGWRYAYLGMAGIIAIFAFPALVLLVREPVIDNAGDAARLGVVPALDGVARQAAVRDRLFWRIGAAMFLAPFAIIGTVGHLFPMLTERGVGAGAAATALSFIYVGGMIGQLSAGYLLDRFGNPRIVLPYFLGAFAGVVLLHLVATSAVLLPGAFLMGLGQGAEMSILAYLTSRYFGLKEYGAIYGRLFGLANFGIAAGLLSMGVAHDGSGEYGVMGPIFLGALALVLLLFGTLPAYRFSVRDSAPPETLVEQEAVT